MNTPYICAETTVDDEVQAKRLAHLAVERGLCACASISAVKSVYLWKEQVEEAAEQRITFKLNTSQLRALQDLILAEHPYELPQWISWPVSCSTAYGQWITESEQPTDGDQV